MKFLYLCLTLAIFASCTDNTLEPGKETAASSAQLRINGSPDNPANPYDFAGQLFDNLFQAYFANPLQNPTTQ
ncbi:MAG: hypothetical protein EOP49_42130, partial [Sphingobacteriales bacterium]